jgi:hypothetical protein
LVTVSVALPDTDPEVAVIVLVPAATAEAIPMVPLVLLMVATAEEEELHVTELVRFFVLLSLNVPVATNCAVVPGAIEGVVVVTARETSVGGGGGPTWPPEPPPHARKLIVNSKDTKARARFTPTSSKQRYRGENCKSLLCERDQGDTRQVRCQIRASSSIVRL